MTLLRRLLRAIFLGLLALLLLFEEWGWEPLAALLARLARLPLWAWVERQIMRLPPWGAVLVFVLPGMALLPVKLLAVYAISAGHPMMGLLVLLLAKVAGTALLARLFSLTQPALMRLPWFARWYPRWKGWKDGLLERVRQTPAWLALGRMREQVKARWASLRRQWR